MALDQDAVTDTTTAYAVFLLQQGAHNEYAHILGGGGPKIVANLLRNLDANKVVNFLATSLEAIAVK
jgi:hypothetical protein